MMEQNPGSDFSSVRAEEIGTGQIQAPAMHESSPRFRRNAVRTMHQCGLSAEQIAEIMRMMPAEVIDACGTPYEDEG